MNNETRTVLTVRDLRHRWKPHKERLLVEKGEQATAKCRYAANGGVAVMKCPWIASESVPPSNFVILRIGGVI